MTTEQLVSPKVDEREWVRLQEELSYIFAKPLKMSRRQYLDTLPEYTPQPIQYQGRFDTLVLVQPPQADKGLTFEIILDMVGVDWSDKPDVLAMQDWEDDKDRFRTPAIAYATWLTDGTKNLNITPQQVREHLLTDERGGTGLDGVFLYVADRGVLRRHYFDLPGSQVDPDETPSMNLWDGRPEFYAFPVNHADPYFGSVVAGREIVTK